jgi:outer membrane lipoprotein carrier protein
MAFNQKSDLVVVELYDTFGHNTVLHFSNLQRNPKLSPRLFKFEPPPDADILRDE